MEQQQPQQQQHQLPNYSDKSHFYLVDLLDIYKRHLRWTQTMPRVKPYYMLKCNQLPEIVSLLGSLGAGFCCTNKQELDRALKTTSRAHKAAASCSDQVIVANPCKTRVFIKQLRQQQVELVAFDSADELHKMAALYPTAKLVMRIHLSPPAESDAAAAAAHKSSWALDEQYAQFGLADLARCHELLALARQLDLEVVGVSFHEPNWRDAELYYRAIGTCRSVFEMARDIGHRGMYLLDIGGGFPAHDQKLFERLAAAINGALDCFFPPDLDGRDGHEDQPDGAPSSGNHHSGRPKLSVIAEPGRYYVASSTTLLTKVLQKRVHYDETQRQDYYSYSLGDGVYGAFNDLLLAPADGPAHEPATAVQPRLLNEKLYADRKLRPSILWGPTPDPMDCIKRNFMFPELEIGDWLAFRNRGAYGCCLAGAANGLDQATVVFAQQVDSKQWV